MDSSDSVRREGMICAVNSALSTAVPTLISNPMKTNLKVTGAQTDNTLSTMVRVKIIFMTLRAIKAP
jgi:hypothetical protein